MSVSETLALDVRAALANIDSLDRKLTQTTARFETGLAQATRQLDVKVDSKEVTQATASVEKLGDTLEETARKQDDAAAAAKRHDDSLEKIGRTSLVAGAGLAAAFGGAVFAAANFEQELSNVAAVSGATGQQLERLREAALEAGAATVFSAAEAAQAEAELGRAGVSVADILGGALRGALDLAAAGQIDLATAAAITATTLNVFRLSGKDAAHVADVLAAGASKSAAGVLDLGEGLTTVGPIADQMNVSLEDTVGVLALLADRGIKGAEAGTQLNRVLLSVAGPTNVARDAMEQLGLSFFNANGEFIGFAATAQVLKERLSGLSDEQRQAALNTIFGTFGIRAANQLYEAGAAVVTDYTTAVNDQGAASRIAGIQLDNLAGDFEQLSGSIETALISGGSQATGILRELTQSATAAVNAFTELPGPIQAGVVGMVGLGGAVLLTVGGISLLVPKFHQASAALIEMGGAAGFAGRNLGTIAKVGGGFVGLAAGFTVVGTSAIGTATGLATMAASGAALGSVIPGVGTAIGAATGFVVGLGKVLLTGGESVETYRRRIAGLSAELEALGARQAARKFFDALGDEDKIRAIGGDVNALTDEIRALATASPAAALRVIEGFRGIRDASGNLVFTESQLTRLTEAANRGADANKRHADNAAEAASANEAFAGAAGVATEAVEEEVDIIKEYTDVLDILFGRFLDSQSAFNAFEAAIDDLTAAVKENGNTLDADTEKGRANRDALINTAEAAINHSEAVLRETDSVQVATRVLGENITRLYDTARATGLSEDAALDYTASLFGIPPGRRTEITNTADLARIATEGLLGKYQEIPGEKETNVFIKNYDNVIAQLGEIQRALNQISLGAEFGLFRGGVQGGGQVEPRMAGGPSWPDGSYLVGEQGMELFRPTTPGMIIPHPQTMGLGGGGASSVDNSFNVGGIVVNGSRDPERTALSTVRKLRAAAFFGRS